MSEKKNPTWIIAIAAGTDTVYNQIHKAAREAGMSLWAFILWKTIGLKLEPKVAKKEKEPKPKKAAKGKPVSMSSQA